MTLTVNGTERAVPRVRTVRDLLTHLNLDPRAVVVELNRTIIRRPAIDETPVSEGDTVELVHFVGGG